MPINPETLTIYRMIHIRNLEHDLQYGLCSKEKRVYKPDYVSIGSKEIIEQRGSTAVKCYKDTNVNDYVHFYFSIRTPMLYNIITGRGVDKYPQEDIVYVCCKVFDLVSTGLQYCFTDGNAAKGVTCFYTDVNDLETKIDWYSINTTDFRDNNKDGDKDRVRKKHAEFLVKEHVPTHYIKEIIVFDKVKKNEVETITKKLNIKIKVSVNPGNKYYF